MTKPTKGICVDGSCCPNPGNVQWQGLDLATNSPLFRSKSIPEGSNNIAEFLAIVHALALHPQSTEMVYSDSKCARVWIRTADPSFATVKTKVLGDIVKRAVNWLKTNPESKKRVQVWETANWGENPADFGRKWK